jgi:hypothetical protein
MYRRCQPDPELGSQLRPTGRVALGRDIGSLGPVMCARLAKSVFGRLQKDHLPCPVLFDDDDLCRYAARRGLRTFRGGGVTALAL